MNRFSEPITTGCDHSQEFGELVNFLDENIGKMWFDKSKRFYNTINIAPLPITAIKDRNYVINLNTQSLKYYNLTHANISKKGRKLYLQNEDEPITIDRLLHGLKELYNGSYHFENVAEKYSSIYLDIKFGRGEYEIIPQTGKTLPAFYHPPIKKELFKQDHFRDLKRLANIILMPSIKSQEVIYMFTLTTPVGSDPNFYAHSCDSFQSDGKCRLYNEQH